MLWPEPVNKSKFSTTMNGSSDHPLPDHVVASLRCEEQILRMETLRALTEQSPREVLDVIVSLLVHPEKKIRRRAGGALSMYAKSHGEPVNVEQKADELARYLRDGEDSRVRLACAIVLMSVAGSTVDKGIFRPYRTRTRGSSKSLFLKCGTEGAPTEPPLCLAH